MDGTCGETAGNNLLSARRNARVPRSQRLWFTLWAAGAWAVLGPAVTGYCQGTFGRGLEGGDPMYRWAASVADLRTPGSGQAAERRAAAARAMARGQAWELVPKLESAMSIERIDWVREEMWVAIDELSAIADREIPVRVRQPRPSDDFVPWIRPRAAGS